MEKNIDLSFVIPAYNEGDEIEGFLLELFDELKNIEKSFEVIVLDGDTENSSRGIIEKLQKDFDFLQYHVLHHPGISVVDKSNKYRLGFKLAKGKYIFQMDADGQDVPSEIPKFLEKLNQGYDMVTGWKQDRKDSFFYKFSSKIANGLVRKLTGVNVHDMNNGFKAYKSNVAKSLNLNGGYFRFIPLILTKQGYVITEVPVKHRKRSFGKGKFTFVSRLKSLFDFFSLLVILKMNNAPFYVLGWGGVISFLIAFLFLISSFLLNYFSFSLFTILFSISFSIFFFLISFLFLLSGILIEYFRFYFSSSTTQ